MDLATEGEGGAAAAAAAAAADGKESIQALPPPSPIRRSFVRSRYFALRAAVVRPTAKDGARSALQPLSFLCSVIFTPVARERSFEQEGLRTWFDFARYSQRRQKWKSE